MFVDEDDAQIDQVSDIITQDRVLEYLDCYNSSYYVVSHSYEDAATLKKWSLGKGIQAFKENYRSAKLWYLMFGIKEGQYIHDWNDGH
jgi:hypothetical protein